MQQATVQARARGKLGLKVHLSTLKRRAEDEANQLRGHLQTIFKKVTSL